MNCSETGRFIPAYVDGEFSEPDRAEIEQHLDGCEGCREQARAHVKWKSSLRARLDPMPAPYGLHLRIQRALDAEVESQTGWRRFWWRITPAMLAACALGLLVVRLRLASPVVEQSILDHKRDWPVEVAGPDPEGVASWFRGKVDFPVRPPRFGSEARLLGGRIGHLERQHAAQLVYFVPGGHKVTVFVFDPGQLPIAAPQRIVVQDRPVYMGGRQGYHVALFQDHGIGYAVASDLDENDMIRLVSQSFSR